MPSFSGTEIIVIQPNDANIAYKFSFPIKSSADATEGYLPYGTTISGAVVTAHKDDDTDATADVIVSSTAYSDYVEASLQYPSTNGEGNYHLKFVLTFSNGATKEEDFNRVIARDL